MTGFLEDFVSFGHGVGPGEHVVTAAEAGRTVRDLPALDDALVLGVARGPERRPCHEMASWTLEAGHIVVFLRRRTGHQAA